LVVVCTVQLVPFHISASVWSLFETLGSKLYPTASQLVWVTQDTCSRRSPESGAAVETECWVAHVRPFQLSISGCANPVREGKVSPDAKQRGVGRIAQWFAVPPMSQDAAALRNGRPEIAQKL